MKTKTKPKSTATHDYMRIDFEVKSFDAETGEFTGYAAAFGNVDELKDVCLEGCFAETLERWKSRGTWPRVYWQHWYGVGHVTELYEDEHGLFVKGRFWIDREDVADVYAEICEAMPNVGLSFGFHAVDFEVKDGVRYLAKVDLTDDITVTLKPVNDQAAMIEVKSEDGERFAVPSIRATEGILRDAGFSRGTAKAILAGGYANALREATGKKSEDNPAALEIAQNILDRLKRTNGSKDQ